MVSARATEVGQTFLNACLVEGDPEYEKRARKGKRRALALSIFLQIIIVSALVLFPLLSKGERISLKEMTPLPPIRRLGNRSHNPAEQRRPSSRPPICRFCAPPRIPTVIATKPPAAHQQISDSSADDSDLSRYGSPKGDRDGIAESVSEIGPVPPSEKKNKPDPAPRIHVGTIQPAMLTRRVEPSYPPLARQLRREGRVELHAVISTDGTVQSLEVVSGDPLFFQSALAAVREWRYRPTILNGQPVEVDTHITVIYTLSR